MSNIKHKHPSIIPDVEGNYMLLGWYGDTIEATWIKDEGHSWKYGLWRRLDGSVIDPVAIRGWMPLNE